MKRFVAVYDEAAVRDTQICKEDPNSVSPEMDDVWEDWPNAPVYIGLFAGVDEAGATKAACETESCDANCIRLIPVGDYDEEFHYLLKFAAGAEFWTNGLPAEHLRALWMSYCFHEALTVDMPEYAAKLEILFNHLPDDHSGIWWTSFQEFAKVSYPMPKARGIWHGSTTSCFITMHRRPRRGRRIGSILLGRTYHRADYYAHLCRQKLSRGCLRGVRPPSPLSTQPT